MARNHKTARDGLIVVLFLLILCGTFLYIFLVSIQDMNIIPKDYIGLRTHSIDKKTQSLLTSPFATTTATRAAAAGKKPPPRHKKPEFPDWSIEHWTPIHVLYGTDPQFELCELDFQAYYEAPHAYPMFKDFIQKSNCKPKKMSYSSIMEEINHHQGQPQGRIVAPTGFVFHESRVGSTLVANMLASNPWAMVFAESSTAHDALLSCPQCSREDHIRYFQQVITIMGRSPVHEMLFFKFQSSTTTAISIALEAFPDVPWIFLYRHPVQTMVSHLLPRGAKGKLTKMAPCLRSMHHESPTLAAVMQKHVPEGTNSHDFEPWCASHLTVLCESAISAYEQYSLYDNNTTTTTHNQRGALVNYDSIPGIIPKIIFPLFHLKLTSKWLEKMTDESTKYSKSRKQDTTEFAGDSEDKEERATEGIVIWANKILQPSYDVMDRAALESVQRILIQNEETNQVVSLEEEKRSLERNVEEGESIDWSQWKEMPHVDSLLVVEESEGEEEEQEQEKREEETNPRKLLPIMRQNIPESEMSEIEFLTGDPTNKIDETTGRIEVGLHAAGVRSTRFEEINCPDEPEPDYPRTYNMKDVLDHWNPDDITVPSFHYNSLCYFNFQTELHKAINYRNADVPYLLYNIPEVDQVVKKWKSIKYLQQFFGTEKFNVEVSAYLNHFLYFHGKDSKHIFFNRTGDGPWIPPTHNVEFTFEEWYNTITQELKKMSLQDRTFYYFRVDETSLTTSLFHELNFFHPSNSISSNFIINKDEIKGLHCRFGMSGIVAEAHYDGHLNMAGSFGGIRRWILSHPNQCSSLYLHPREHPSGRHSEINWALPNYRKYEKFHKAQVNEIIMTGGMVLYIPTNWFHYIISLNVNYQCNIRSGKTKKYDKFIHDCGF